MRGPQVLRRSRLLVVAEGNSERAFATWLQQLCDGEGLRFHFDIIVAGGGDTRAIVEYAVEQRRKRNQARIRDTGALVFLDADRAQADRAAGRGPDGIRGRGNLLLVWLKPNLEWLLVRLHSGHETLRLQPNDASSRLRQLRPEYNKPASAAWLRRHFSLDDLRRAARHDHDLNAVLALLGLGTARS